MQTSRIIRTLALVLFFLFPLLSVVQLRDTDAPWRRVADRVRPSVVQLRDTTGNERACGLIIQDRPLRVVTVGVVGEAVVSQQGDTQVSWAPILVDTQKRFTILQVQPTAHEVASSSGMPGSTLLDVAGSVMRTDGVKAALVGPSEFEDAALWVGVLHPASSSSEGDPSYRASLMRRIDAVAAVPTTDAWAVGEESIDPRLRGAPFVDAAGNVVGLYRTHRGHHEDVLPIHVVCQALVFLHLQAAQ